MKSINMLTKQELLDLQFIEIRHKLIDLGAFLDRIDRHEGESDFRVSALKDAIQFLGEDRPDRSAAILNALSDHSTELPQSATFQGATGAAQS